MPKGQRWPPELINHIVRLAADGTDYRQISAETGMSLRTIREYVSKARGKGLDIPDRRLKEERNRAKYLYIGNEIIFAFEAEAEKRNLQSPSHLIRRLLHIIAKEPNLIDAILDGD